MVTSAGTVPDRSAQVKNRWATAKVAALGQQYLSDLAVLVDCTVQMRPPAAHLDVCLVGEPPITRHVAARPCRLGELAREPLHPPVHCDVIDGNAALGE